MMESWLIVHGALIRGAAIIVVIVSGPLLLRWLLSRVRTRDANKRLQSVTRLIDPTRSTGIHR